MSEEEGGRSTRAMFKSERGSIRRLYKFCAGSTRIPFAGTLKGVMPLAYPHPCLTRASWASPAVPPKWALIYREGGKVTAHGLSLLSGRDHTLFSAGPGVLTFLREPQYLWESHDPCLLAAMAAAPLPSSIPRRGQGCRRIFAPEDKTALRTTYPWVPESPSVTSTRTKILSLNMVYS